MCRVEVTEERPSVIGSSLYTGDVSDSRIWTRPASLFFFWGVERKDRGARFPQPRPSDADGVCSVSSVRQTRRKQTTLFGGLSRTDAAFERNREALSFGSTAYILYIYVRQHFEYLYYVYR